METALSPHRELMLFLRFGSFLCGFLWSFWGGSNSRPVAYETTALPTELQKHIEKS